MITCSMSAGSRPARFTASLAAMAPRSMADTDARAPPGLPSPRLPPIHSVIGVRAPARNTTSFWSTFILRSALLRIVVEAAAALSSVMPRQHHALEQRRGSEVWLLELVEHDVGDVIGGVEPHEVEQGERAHRIAAAQLHGVVDILARRHAGFQHADRVEQVRDE